MKDDWKMWADLLRDGVLEEADARRLTVVCQGLRTTVEFDEGLTQDHYNLFAPLLSTDSEKAELALGVIANILHSISCVDWLELKRILFDEWDDFLEWLLQRICLDGFDAVAKLIEEWWMEYRRTNPPTCVKVFGLVHPTWDSHAGMLSFGNKRWKFRLLPGRPLKELLDELERCSWPSSVTLGHLGPEQVRDVAKELRAKTKGYIYWSASSDSRLGWRWNS
jgi:hypothetical protein